MRKLILIKEIILWVFLVGMPLALSAQNERSLTRDGNKLFDKGKYEDAEVSYKKALEKKNNFSAAIFNLGDAQYKQKRFDEAAKQFELAAKVLAEPKQRAQSFHNLGNCKLEKQAWQEAVNAYKNSLKINPTDRETKYNLAYANAKLKEKKQNDQKNKDNKDQKNQPKEQDKKEGKDPKDNPKEGGEGDQKEDKKPEPKKGNRQELSKEQAEKMLEALKNEEQKTQDKMQRKDAKPVEVKIEKDW